MGEGWDHMEGGPAWLGKRGRAAYVTAKSYSNMRQARARESEAAMQGRASLVPLVPLTPSHGTKYHSRFAVHGTILIALPSLRPPPTLDSQPDRVLEIDTKYSAAVSSNVKLPRGT